MLKLMEKESDEYKCLYNALRKVEEVADFINEMQRISETYTPVFQSLCKRFPEIEVSIITDKIFCHWKFQFLTKLKP